MLSTQPQIHGDVSLQEAPLVRLPATSRATERPITNNVPIARPWWLPKEQWPFQTLSMDVNGQRIAVTDVGSGPALLFIHTGLWSFIWRDLIQLLASDFRCVCFDSPGTGLSDRVSLKKISFEAASLVATAVIERLNLGHFTLVVHDLGGPVGIAGAAEVSEHVQGIAAINSFGWKPVDFKLRLMLSLVSSSVVRELDVFTNLLPRITASSFGVGLRMDTTTRNAFRSGIGRAGLRAFHEYMREARRNNGFYQRVSEALSGPFQRLPLLTIFGQRNDPFGFQQRWKEMFPDAHQLVIPGGNHFPMCDDPRLVADTLRDWHRKHIAVESKVVAKLKKD